MISFKRILVAFVFLSVALVSNFSSADDLKKGLYAQIDTSKGQIVAELYYDIVPMTVINFAGLAEGTIASDKRKQKKYYDGLIFHRVMKDFMIQGGDPTGTGMGGPGYKFADEFSDKLKHDSPGLLSMANAGPNTNGSQFFITHRATHWLDNKHSVFGKVIKGMDVVNKIRKGDKINTVKIIRIGKAAKSFKTDQVSFNAHLNKIKENKSMDQKTLNKDFQAEILKKYPDAKTTESESGLMYVLVKEGEGQHPASGAKVTVHYTGTFMDGKVFDSSVDRGTPLEFAVGMGQVIKGWDEALQAMKKGEKRTLLIPYWLAYGEQGHPGGIPPKSDLVFDVELIDFK